METDTIIQTSNLTKQYNHQLAVDRLSFSVKKGEIFGFLGPNGAGKTTTLLMLLGLSQPSGGNARVCGLDPIREPRKVKRLVGYLPENVGFYNDMDALQSLEFISELNGIDRDEARERISESLDIVRFSIDDRKKKVETYSRGMRQRLGIAEVLIKKHEVLFLDEPTLGLDPDGALRVIELIESLNKEKQITVLISSHNLYQVQKISHRVSIMIKGQMVAEGSIETLAQEKFGVGEKKYTLEEIYMKYFQEV